jgi:hypothetical protein
MHTQAHIGYSEQYQDNMDNRSKIPYKIIKKT